LILKLAAVKADALMLDCCAVLSSGTIRKSRRFLNRRAISEAQGPPRQARTADLSPQPRRWPGPHYEGGAPCQTIPDPHCPRHQNFHDSDSIASAGQHTTDHKKKARWKGGVLYFGRVQSAHLFEALSIIKEIKHDKDLMTAVERADSKTKESFAGVAKFIGSKDYVMMAKLRNVVAFHYESKLVIRRLKKIIDTSPGHSMTYSLGNATLDWYFELGDLIADEIVIREVFQIPDSANIEQAATEVLDRLRIIALAFLDFAGYFIRACCAR
jgi:hypothetical protein